MGAVAHRGSGALLSIVFAAETSVLVSQAAAGVADRGSFGLLALMLPLGAAAIGSARARNRVVAIALAAVAVGGSAVLGLLVVLGLGFCGIELPCLALASPALLFAAVAGYFGLARLRGRPAA